MTLLCDLAFKYGSDKCPQINHTYTPFYYRMFNNKRRRIKKVLEIGIGSSQYMWNTPPHYVTGASLKMWRDFFPYATVYGADIERSMLFEEERIKTFYCDQSSKADLEKLIENTGRDLDIVIDDGSHHLAHQVFTAKTLMPLLKKEVVYIIEDVSFPKHMVADLSEYWLEIPVFHMKQGLRKNRIAIVHRKV